MGRGFRLCVALPMNNAQGTPVPVEYPVRKRASVPSGIIIPPPKRNATMTLADAAVGGQLPINAASAKPYALRYTAPKVFDRNDGTG